jgi:hypothetical protein
MFERLQKLPDNLKNILAVILSIMIILIVVISLSFLNQLLKTNLASLRDFLN